MNDVAFGQYYPVSSLMHKLDARTKFLAMIAFIVLMFFVDSFVVYGIVAFFLFFVILITRVPFFRVVRSIKAVLFLLLFTFIFTAVFSKGLGAEAETTTYGFYIEYGIFTICGSGLIAGAKLVCRILLLVLGPAIMTFTTTPVALADAIEHLLTPLKLLFIPIHEFAMIMSIALKLIPQLMDETVKIMNAQKARGASFDHGNIFKRALALLPVLIPLLVSSFRLASDLGDAMESRCYHGGKRTRLKRMKYGLLDLLFWVLFIAFYFGVLLLTYNWFGLEIISAFVII